MRERKDLALQADLRPDRPFEPSAGAEIERIREFILQKDPEAGGDVVADVGEPFQLVIGEAASVGFLLGEPVVEAVRNLVLVGDELAIVVEGVADEGDDIGEDALAGATDFGAV